MPRHSAQSPARPHCREAAARSPIADAWLALGIFVVAFAGRLVFLLNSPDRHWPHSTFYEGDAIVWVDWARAIDEGGVYQFDLPIHPPGVAYAIAWLYEGVRISGFVGMKLLWCAMSAAACAFTFLACAGVMSRRIALVASLLLAFSFNQYVLATSINNETPYVMLVPLIVLLTQRVIAHPTRWKVAALGISHGLAMLLRAEHPLLLLLLLGWMLLAPARVTGQNEFAAQRAPMRSRAFTAIVICAIGIAVCLPWTIHAIRATNRFNTIELPLPAYNLAPVEWTASARTALDELPAFAHNDLFAVLNHWAQTQGKTAITAEDIRGYLLEQFNWILQPLPTPVFVSNQGPFSFALANHPQADGGFSRAALAHPMRGDDPTFAFAFPPHNRVFVDGWRVGWGYIKDDARTWLRNVGRKFQRFADGVTGGFGAANLPLGRNGVREPVDILVSDSQFARPWRIVVLALIVAGMACAIARRMPISLWLLVILYKLIVTLVFYGYARQAASIPPAFFVFIAIANDTLLLPFDRRTPGIVRRHAVVAVLTCLLLLAGDIVFARRQPERIDGQSMPRPELGSGAFQAFNRIEIR